MAFGASCPHQSANSGPLPDFIPTEVAEELQQVLGSDKLTISEDCKISNILDHKLRLIRDDALGLSVNVVVPASAKKGDKLPVVLHVLSNWECL